MLPILSYPINKAEVRAQLAWITEVYLPAVCQGTTLTVTVDPNVNHEWLVVMESPGDLAISQVNAAICLSVFKLSHWRVFNVREQGGGQWSWNVKRPWRLHSSRRNREERATRIEHPKYENVYFASTRKQEIEQ